MNDLLRQAGHAGTVQRATIGHVTERMTDRYSDVRLPEMQHALANVRELVNKSGDPSGDSPTETKNPSEDIPRKGHDHG